MKQFLQYIKYSWNKERKNPNFNFLKYLLKLLDFYKYTKANNPPKQRLVSRGLQAFTTYFALFMILFVISARIENSKEKKSQSVVSQVESPKIDPEKALAEKIALEKKLAEEKTIEKLIKDFVFKNSKLLGTYSSYTKVPDSDFYTISIIGSPYSYTIKIIDGSIVNEYISIKKDYLSDSAELNADGTINIKSFKKIVSNIDNMLELEVIDKKIQSQFDAWNGSNIYLVYALKSMMNDPKSFKHVETQYYKDKKNKKIIHVIMKFRGKNAFGATVLNTIRAKMDIDGNILEYSLD